MPRLLHKSILIYGLQGIVYLIMSRGAKLGYAVYAVYQGAMGVCVCGGGGSLISKISFFENLSENFINNQKLIC